MSATRPREPSRFSVWWSFESRVDQLASVGALAIGLVAIVAVLLF